MMEGVLVRETTDSASGVVEVGELRSDTVIGLDSASLISPLEYFLMFSSLCSLRNVRMAALRMIVLDFESRRWSGSLRMKCQVSCCGIATETSVPGFKESIIWNDLIVVLGVDTTTPLTSLIEAVLERQRDEHF